MRVWTQAQYDAVGCMDGSYRLGTGDFRKVDFGGRGRVIIGPHSILGNYVRLGRQCEIGAHCEIGKYFKAGAFLYVGEHTRIGIGAKIGECSELSRGVVLGEGCEIGLNTRMGDDVSIPARCELFEMDHVVGSTVLRVSPLSGRTYYSFLAYVTGVCEMHVSENGNRPIPLTQFMDKASRAATNTYADQRHIEEGRQMLAMAKYLQARQSLLLM